MYSKVVTTCILDVYHYQKRNDTIFNLKLSMLIYYYLLGMSNTE